MILIRVWYHICLHLIRIGQAVGAAKYIHHGDKLCDGFIVQSEPLHGGTVGVNSVSAVVGNGHRQGDDFLGQRIELAGFHHGF